MYGWFVWVDVFLTVFCGNHNNKKSGNTCGEDDAIRVATKYLFLFFFAVLAARLKFAFVGAPGAPFFSHLLTRASGDPLSLGVNVCI